MIDLAWTAETGPHLVLEVGQACNITCNGCYKLKSEDVKPLEQILDDVDLALAKRCVHTVSIAGAEPTLHPRLCDVVRSLHERKLRTAVISNGLALDDAYLARLKEQMIQRGFSADEIERVIRAGADEKHSAAGKCGGTPFKCDPDL